MPNWMQHCNMMFINTYSSHINIMLGIEDLKADLNQDIDSEQINSLCSYSQSEARFTYPRFQSLSALSPVLPEFSLRIRNKVFFLIWKNSIANAQTDGTDLTVSSICEIVWPSMLDKIRLLKAGLSQQTLPLSAVHEYFSELRCEIEITETLKDIWTFHDKYTNVKETTMCSVDTIKAISNYWFLRECQQAAEAIITLQQELSQAGDFSYYERIVQMVSEPLCCGKLFWFLTKKLVV